MRRERALELRGRAATHRASERFELRRFAQRFGVEAMIDRGSRRFADLGLGAARLGDERWLEKLAEEPLLLRMPLVRQQQRLTIGDAEATWREWTGR